MKQKLRTIAVGEPRTLHFLRADSKNSSKSHIKYDRCGIQKKSICYKTPR
jgi:hypothetical protein